MKIIVTGGAGFIASHVVDGYVKAGHKVAVLDNLSSGFRKNLNPKARFYKADIRNLDKVRNIFRREKPEAVNHHAAIASVVKSVRNPTPTLETNVIGTANVLTAFGENGSGRNRKFIFSSTGGALYGNPEKLPAGENTPLLPLSPYGLSKLLGEEIIKFYSRSFGFKHLIFRYPNVYGPRQNPRGEAGVVAIFGWEMKNGKRPTIFGDGTKSRDYAYVGDIVRANMLALKKGNNETINLGWGKLVSDQETFDTIAAELCFEGKPLYRPYRKGEVYKVSLDPRKARKILGWRPKVRLEQGIALTMKSL